MPVHQIIYVSRFCGFLDQPKLDEIVHTSARKNAKLEVSGVLLASGGTLLQLLEGDRDVVKTLYDRIARDERHTAVSCLVEKAVATRLYPEWSMALADITRRQTIDQRRLTRLLVDASLAHDTKHFTVEARLLIRDFLNQAKQAA